MSSALMLLAQNQHTSCTIVSALETALKGLPSPNLGNRMRQVSREAPKNQTFTVLVLTHTHTPTCTRPRIAGLCFSSREYVFGVPSPYGMRRQEALKAELAKLERSL